MNGNFKAEWYPGDIKNNYSIFAIYEDQMDSFIKSKVYNVSISYPKISLEALNATLPDSGPYIEIYNNDWNTRTLNVYVVAKDEYSKKFILQAENAINDLSTKLRQQSGDSRAWELKVIKQIINPINIMVELKHEGDNCDPQGFWGAHDTNPLQKILNHRYTIEVFTGCNTEAKAVEVYWTTMHEMQHAMGLGHTWHELGDMMCSREQSPINGEWTETCNANTDLNNYDDDKTPTIFDVRAIVNSYGNDGFENPNPNIARGYKYFCHPLPCEPPFDSTTPKKPGEPPVDKPLRPIKPPTEDKVDEVREKKITTSKIVTTKTLGQEYYFIKKLGFPGTGKGQILEPTDLSIDTTRGVMYVADKNNNRIQKLDLNGNYLASWGSRGSNTGQFISPSDLAVDYSASIVFVADLGNNRIQKFDINGTFLDTWGSFGRGSGQFDHVGDIDLDTKSMFVYVTDIGNHRVQKFDYDGKFIDSWGAQGVGDGQFDRPAGLTYDTSGIVFVADTNNNRIQKFDTEGKFLGMWGQFGKGPGQFDNPVSLSIDPTSNFLYVSDSGNKRITIFDQVGKYINSWGLDGTADGEFERPVSVAFGDEGQVYVSGQG